MVSSGWQCSQRHTKQSTENNLKSLPIYHKAWYSPRRPLQYHSLVCIEKYLFIVGIGPIRKKELMRIFRFFCPYV